MSFKYSKEREQPQKHEWLQVEHGVDGVLEPKFRLLQEHLGEGPANAADERGTQHQGKALDVELRGLVGEHEEASGDEENHQDQRRSQLLQLEDQREDQDEEDSRGLGHCVQRDGDIEEAPVGQAHVERCRQCCGSYSSEVVGPAEHHAGPVAGALNQGPRQGGEQEDHGQVQHRHEQGEVEALGQPLVVEGDADGEAVVEKDQPQRQHRPPQEGHVEGPPPHPRKRQLPSSGPWGRRLS